MREHVATADRFRLMCVDTERARKNREMVVEKRCIEFWLALEQVSYTPRSQPLPKWALGELPYVGNCLLLS